MARSFFERDEILEGLTKTIEPQRQRATAKWRVLSQLAQGRSSENLPSSFGTDARSNFLDLLFGMEDLNQFDSPIELPPDSASTKILTEVASSTRRDEDVFNSMRRILGDPRLSTYAAYAAHQILLERFNNLNPRSSRRPFGGERKLNIDTLIIGNGTIGTGTLSLVNAFPGLYGRTAVVSATGPGGPWSGRGFPLNNSFNADGTREGSNPFPLLGDPSIILPDTFLLLSDRLSLSLHAKGRRADVTTIECEGPEEIRKYASGTMYGDMIRLQELFASTNRTGHFHHQSVDLSNARATIDRTEIPSSGRFGDLTFFAKNILVAGGPGEERCPIGEDDSESATIWRRQQEFARAQVKSARAEIETIKKEQQGGDLYFRDEEYFGPVSDQVAKISLPGVLGLQAFGEVAELFTTEAVSLPEANPFVSLFDPKKRYAIVGGGDSGDTWVRLLKGGGDKSLYPKGYLSKGRFPEAIQFGGFDARRPVDRRRLYQSALADTEIRGRVVAWRINPEVGFDQRAKPWLVVYETKNGNGTTRTDTVSVDGILTGAGLDLFNPDKAFPGDISQSISPILSPEEQGNVGLQIPELGMLLLGSMCLGSFIDRNLNFPTYLQQIKDELDINQNSLSVWLWRACTSEALFADVFSKLVAKQ